MKKLNVGLKIILSILTVIAIICSASFIRSLIQRHRIATRKPFLRIETKVPNFWVLIGSKNYYIVYDNVILKKRKNFPLRRQKPMICICTMRKIWIKKK